MRHKFAARRQAEVIKSQNRTPKGNVSKAMIGKFLEEIQQPYHAKTRRRKAVIKRLKDFVA